MGKFYDFVLETLDLRNKIILDAAVGAGESTYFWAKRIHEQGGTSKIISVDNDLPQVWKDKVKTRLGEYSSYVELKEADIFDLSFLEDESIDIVNCDDTVVFLNPKPLKLLLALKELKRVLKPSGYLIIPDYALTTENTENHVKNKRVSYFSLCTLLVQKPSLRYTKFFY